MIISVYTLRFKDRVIFFDSFFLIVSMLKEIQRVCHLQCSQ